LSETQIGLPGPTEVPHGFRRFGSVWAARPGTSETRFVCTYDRPAIPPPSLRAEEANPANATTASGATRRAKRREFTVVPFVRSEERRYEPDES